MVLFVVIYVWQNIDMMRMKIDYEKALRTEKQLIKDNDRLRYEIEKFKSMDVIIKYAEENGMKRLTPMDFDAIVIRKKRRISSQPNSKGNDRQ